MMTSIEMAKKLSDLFEDVLSRKAEPDMANAAANVARTQLKLTELQHRFAGTSRKDIFAVPPSPQKELEPAA